MSSDTAGGGQQEQQRQLDGGGVFAVSLTGISTLAKVVAATLVAGYVVQLDVVLEGSLRYLALVPARWVDGWFFEKY